MNSITNIVKKLRESRLQEALSDKFVVIDNTPELKDEYRVKSREEAVEKVNDLIDAGSDKDKISIVPLKESDDSFTNAGYEWEILDTKGDYTLVFARGKRLTPYVVAWKLDKSDGSWAQGHYFDSEKKARDYLKQVSESSMSEGTSMKRIATTTEFDNGRVFHNWQKMSDEEAEELAKQKSIENPDKIFYVAYDDIMNPSSDIKWKNGVKVDHRGNPLKNSEKLGEADEESSEDNKAYQEFIKKCQDNPTWKKANAICEKYGYRLAPLSYVEVYKSGKKVPSVNINVDRTKEYYPEVYYYSGKFGNNKSTIEIQTTAYGSLGIEEHSKFIEAVTSAHKMVEELNKIDFTTLYQDPVD